MGAMESAFNIAGKTVSSCMNVSVTFPVIPTSVMLNIHAILNSREYNRSWIGGAQVIPVATKFSKFDERFRFRLFGC